MNKLITLLILFFSITLFQSNTFSLYKGQQVAITENKVLYRAKPSTKSKIIHRFKAGDIVKILSMGKRVSIKRFGKHHWYKVRFYKGENRITGWVFGAFITDDINKAFSTKPVRNTPLAYKQLVGAKWGEYVYEACTYSLKLNNQIVTLWYGTGENTYQILKITSISKNKLKLKLKQIISGENIKKEINKISHLNIDINSTGYYITTNWGTYYKIIDSAKWYKYLVKYGIGDWKSKNWNIEFRDRPLSFNIRNHIKLYQFGIVGIKRKSKNHFILTTILFRSYSKKTKSESINHRMEQFEIIIKSPKATIKLKNKALLDNKYTNFIKDFK